MLLSLAMNFDTRPGLKYLIGHICKSTVVPNLYQISSLVWSLQFAINFFLCSRIDCHNEESLSVLEELFGEILDIYGAKLIDCQHNDKQPQQQQPFLLQPLNVFEDHFGNQIES